MVYTQKLKNAIKFAVKTHDFYQKQTRKGKGTAYITHPLTVAIILARANATEEVVIAGILHDTIEDSVLAKKVTSAMLAERFGETVAILVISVTEQDRSLPWDVRKEQALEEIKSYSHESIIIKSADVLSNMTELLDDYSRAGDEVFDRFSVPKSKTMHHQLALIAELLVAWPGNPLFEDLSELEKNLKTIQ